MVSHASGNRLGDHGRWRRRDLGRAAVGGTWWKTGEERWDFAGLSRFESWDMLGFRWFEQIWSGSDQVGIWQGNRGWIWVKFQHLTFLPPGIRLYNTVLDNCWPLAAGRSCLSSLQWTTAADSKNHRKYESSDSWFGTCFIFPYIGNSNPNWLSYFSKELKASTVMAYLR